MNADDRVVCNAARKLNNSTGATLEKWNAKVDRSGIRETVEFIANQLRILDLNFCRAEADRRAVAAFSKMLDEKYKR